MTGTAIVGALTAVLAGLASLSKSHEGRVRLRQGAVERLSSAVTTTRAYLRTRWPERDQEIEAQLTDHWFRAAAALRPVDVAISELCRLKGHYWTDPTAWSEQEIEEAKITLAEMTTKLDRLLIG